MVNKTITVRSGKCTTLLVSKSWLMKAWLRDVDQWKAENLAGFCNWPVTRCFIQNDRARLIIEHTTIFALSGNIDGLCNCLLNSIYAEIIKQWHEVVNKNVILFKCYLSVPAYTPFCPSVWEQQTNLVHNQYCSLVWLSLRNKAPVSHESSACIGIDSQCLPEPKTHVRAPDKKG